MSLYTGMTAARIRYLTALAELDPEGKGVRSIMLASKLGVSRPSVHTMITRLEGLGYVKKEFYGIIYLTQEGLKSARYYSECCRKLGESMKDAEADEIFSLLAAGSSVN